MSRSTPRVLLSLFLLGAAAPSVASAHTYKQERRQTPLKRRVASRFLGQWKQSGVTAENPTDPRTAKTFDPAGALYHHNGSLGVDEILIGGHEGLAGYRRPVIKVFQPDSGQIGRVTLPLEAVTVKHESMSGVVYNLVEQGVGVAGKNLVLAGGTKIGAASSFGSSSKLVLVNARSRQVKQLPDLEHPRTNPMVGASPGGSLILIAGGGKTVGDKDIGTASSAVEIFDQTSGKYLDVEASYPGLAKGMKARAFGQVAWVQSEGKERIFFIGGTRDTHQSYNTPLTDIDVYDVGSKSWGKVTLPSPMLSPGVAIRNLGNGKQEIVIAGGKINQQLSGGHVQRDQLYGVLRLDPHALRFSQGDLLPAQPSVRGGGATTVSGGTALVFKDEHLAEGGAISTEAHAIGFNLAYKTPAAQIVEELAPPPIVINHIHVDQRQKVTNITNTAITESHHTTVNTTNVKNTTVHNTAVQATTVRVEE